MKRTHSNGARWLAWGLALAGWTVAAVLMVRQGWVSPVTETESFPDAAAKMTATPDADWSAAFARWEAECDGDQPLAAFCLLDPAGRVIFASPLAERPLCPASALKTLTAAAGLRVLGPDFRFETQVEATADSSPDGTLQGDLVLVGGGDPTLARADLDRLAETLAKSGLRVVAGAVKSAPPSLSGSGVNDHWNWGDLGNAYGAGAYDLNVDANRLTVAFVPGKKPGDAAAVEKVSPAWPELACRNEVRTGPPGSGDRVTVYSMPGGRSLHLSGTVPAGVASFSVGAAMPDPPGFALDYFRKALAAKGVTFRGQSFPSITPSKTLATHQSPPLAQIVTHLNQTSDNLEAQCVFLALGRHFQSDPAAALIRHWREAGVDFRSLRLIDGSGLARANMIRPVDLARVNHLAAAGPHGEVYVASLPSAADGRVCFKPGYMSGVRTEVGFLLDSADRRWTYCLMLNGLDPAKDYRQWRSRWITAVLERLNAAE